MHKVRIGWIAALAAMSSLEVSAQEPQPFPLEGFVITAAPDAMSIATLGNHITVLDGAELRSAGVSQVVEALRSVPGVSVARSGSFGAVSSVFMRGGESDFVLVLIDGVQVNQPGGAFDFSGLTLESVQRIEIVRGPSSALHGSDAIAGVIHVVTERGARGARVEGEVGLGTYGTLESGLRLAGHGTRGSYGLAFGRYETDGVLPYNNEHLNTVVNGHAELNLDGATQVAVRGRYGQREFHFPTDFSGAVVDDNQFTFSDEMSLALDFRRSLRERWDVRALFTSLAVDGGTEDAVDGPADTLGFFGFQSLDAYRRTALDVRSGWRPTEEVALTVGSELERQSVRTFNASQSQFGDGGGRESNRRSNWALYAHASSQWRGLHTTIGVRREDNERYGTFVSTHVGVSRGLWSEARIRGAWGSAVKEPTFFETFASGFARGNPDLDPERTRSWEVGVEQGLGGGAAKLQATYFDQQFRDLIQYSGTPPVVGGPNYFNAAEASARGFEVGGSVFLAGTRLGVDWTHLDTEVVDAGFDEGDGATFVLGERMLRRPSNQWSARLSTALGRARLHGSITWVGERADRDFTAFPATPVELGAYTLVGAGVALPLGASGVSFYLRADNLLEAEYQEVFGFVPPGRTLRVGGRFAR